MDIILAGWSVDRVISVLNLMLRNAGLPQCRGKFNLRENKFVTDAPVSQAVADAISGYFAPATLEQAKAKIQKKCDELLSQSDWLIIRSLDQKNMQSDGDLPGGPSLSPATMRLWRKYRQELRKFPDQIDFENPVWPTEPP